MKAAYLRCAVELFIPNPLRCFNCQLYGHGKNNCKKSTTCARCAQPDHSDIGCTLTEKCTNCNGKHSSFSKDCPKWKVEKEIQRVKVTQGISFPEARRIVESSSPVTPLAGQWAAGAPIRKPVMVSVECQTEKNIGELTSKSPQLPIASSIQQSHKQIIKSNKTHTKHIQTQGTMSGSSVSDGNTHTVTAVVHKPPPVPLVSKAKSNEKVPKQNIKTKINKDPQVKKHTAELKPPGKSTEKTKPSVSKSELSRTKAIDKPPPTQSVVSVSDGSSEADMEVAVEKTSNSTDQFIDEVNLAFPAMSDKKVAQIEKLFGGGGSGSGKKGKRKKSYLSCYQ